MATIAGVSTEASARPTARPARAEFAWAALLFAALTVLLAWPLSAQLADRVWWMGADTELYLWTLLWDTHAFAHDPIAFLQANICYPQRWSLATTENLAGSTLFAAPVIWLTGNPVLALNLASLSSCVLCGLGVFVLARRLGLGRAASLLAGIAFAFSPPRFGRLGQIHLATVQWIPFALAALHRYLDEHRRRSLWLATALFTLQAFTSGHGAVFLLLAIAALAGWHVVHGGRVDLGRRVHDWGLVGLLLLLPAILLTLPYRSVQQDIGLRRQLDETWWSDWRRPALSYVASPAHLPRWIASQFVSLDVIDEAKGFLFPGVLPLALGAAALWPRRRRFLGRSADGSWRQRSRRAGLAVVGLVLLLGSVGCLTAAWYVGWVHPIVVRLGEARLRIRTAWRPGVMGIVLLAGLVALWRGARFSFDLGRFMRHRAAAWRSWQASHLRDHRLFYALLAIGTVWLSAGAPIGPWPWLYSLPGFSFIRVPARFTLLSLMALGVLAAFGFERVTARFGPRRKTATALLLGAGLVAEFAMFPLPTVPYRLEIPEADRWLDSQPKPFVVAEVPINVEGDHTTYMLHSTAHWQPTVNGYTGFRSPLHETVLPIVRGFPFGNSLGTLASLGVTFVVVHPERYRAGQWPAVEAAIAERQDRLTLVHTDGLARVYKLR